jgi:hypothetical protein
MGNRIEKFGDKGSQKDQFYQVNRVFKDVFFLIISPLLGDFYGKAFLRYCWIAKCW